MAIKINMTDEKKVSRMQKRSNAIHATEVAIDVMTAQYYGIKSALNVNVLTGTGSVLLNSTLKASLGEAREEIVELKLNLREMVSVQLAERKSYRQSVYDRRNNPSRVAYRQQKAEQAAQRKLASAAAQSYAAQQNKLSQPKEAVAS